MLHTENIERRANPKEHEPAERFEKQRSDQAAHQRGNTLQEIGYINIYTKISRVYNWKLYRPFYIIIISIIIILLHLH